MGEIMEGVVVHLIAVMNIRQEILEILFVDMLLIVEILQPSAYLKDKRFQQFRLKLKQIEIN